MQTETLYNTNAPHPASRGEPLKATGFRPFCVKLKLILYALITSLWCFMPLSVKKFQMIYTAT